MNIIFAEKRELWSCELIKMVRCECECVNVWMLLYPSYYLNVSAWLPSWCFMLFRSIHCITVKPLLSGHLQDLPKCPFNRGCPLNRGCKNCAMFINDQHSTVLCTVIKLHVVNKAIQSSSSLPFITNFNLLVNAKTLTDFSTYLKDVIQYYYCQFSTVSA